MLIASLICLVLGYAVAYYVGRYGGRRKGLFLVLLVAPFWISYLMRIYAWQRLLQPTATSTSYPRSSAIGPPVDWLAGKPSR